MATVFRAHLDTAPALAGITERRSPIRRAWANLNICRAGDRRSGAVSGCAPVFHCGVQKAASFGMHAAQKSSLAAALCQVPRAASSSQKLRAWSSQAPVPGENLCA